MFVLAWFVGPCLSWTVICMHNMSCPTDIVADPPDFADSRSVDKHVPCPHPSSLICNYMCSQVAIATRSHHSVWLPAFSINEFTGIVRVKASHRVDVSLARSPKPRACICIDSRRFDFKDILCESRTSSSIMADQCCICFEIYDNVRC